MQNDMPDKTIERIKYSYWLEKFKFYPKKIKNQKSYGGIAWKASFKGLV